MSTTRNRFLTFLLLLFPFQLLASPKIVHITKDTVVVRMGADDSDLVYQVVGSNKENMRLYHFNLASGLLNEIAPPKNLRPFGPQVDQGKLFYSAGDFAKKVNIYLYDFKTRKHIMLEKGLAWIPSMALIVGEKGPHLFYDKAKDVDGVGASVHYSGQGVGEMTNGPWNVAGPVFRKDDIPPQYHDQVKNEYPAANLMGAEATLVWQNNEYGTPNIYSLNMQNKEFTRLAPSIYYQERPAISERLIAWEESEKGFAVSNESTLGIIDRQTGELIRIDEKGFYFQARAFGPYAIYGAKRSPAVSTPSIRVYDVDQRVEYQAQNCFPGSIFDFVPTRNGLYVAQKASSSSSRILFATWAEIKNNCKQ